MEDLQREMVDIKEDGTAGEQRHKEEVNRLRAERERTKKEHATQTDELMQRLQNACAQRDEAREQVLCCCAACSDFPFQGCHPFLLCKEPICLLPGTLSQVDRHQ